MLAVIGETSAVERVGVLRVEFDCVAKVGDRALNVALGSVSVAAVEEYQRIFQLALDASNANDFNGRGVIYLDKKQYARAIEDFDQAIRLDPEQALALSNRCWSKVLAGAQMLQALADCNEALRLKPLNAGTIANRAFVYLRLGEINRALAEYNAALEIDPKNAHALYGRSLTQRQSGDTAAAEADAAAAKLIQSNVEAEFANSGIN